MFLKQSLKFSNPETFNDPFDCNEQLLKIDINEDYVKQLLKEYRKKVPKKYLKVLNKEIKNPNIVARTLKTEKQNFKISCFSKKYDEVLMWSHYADKHRGVCIGFDFPYKYSDKFILCPIKYLSEIKKLDGMTSAERIILYWLTSKSERWSYEEEIRAIRRTNNKTNFEYINYNHKYIREIIFGCNISNEDIESSINKIKESDILTKDIKFKKMIIDNDNFLLKEELIK